MMGNLALYLRWPEADRQLFVVDLLWCPGIEWGSYVSRFPIMVRCYPKDGKILDKCAVNI